MYNTQLENRALVDPNILEQQTPHMPCTLGVNVGSNPIKLEGSVNSERLQLKEDYD